MDQETVRQQVRDIRVRRLVQGHHVQVSRVVRCRCTEIVAINVDKLNKFEDGAVVTVASLLEAGVISNPKDGVKILGNGELTKKLTVQVNAFSKSAAEKIEALGGKAEVI